MYLLYQLGRYYMLMMRVFSKPDQHKIFFRMTLREIEYLGLRSLGIIIIISVFMGAVITLQTAYNFENPLIPRYLIGLGARDSMLLEFSSTMIGLIMAGKIGSNIASELGTMRVTEQIDALEIMGVNSANYLILPKITGAIFIFPFLTVISMVVGITGGYLVSNFIEGVTPSMFLVGARSFFVPFFITYSLIKSVFFAFLITSISSFYGYYAQGSALEVGRSSTKAVVFSSIMILVFNLILTQLLLA